MAQYRVTYTAQTTGNIFFTAENDEQAQAILEQLEAGDVEWKDLPGGQDIWLSDSTDYDAPELAEVN